MNTSRMEFEQLKALIEDKLQHTYIDKYIQKPVIDDEKLLILSSIIRHTHLPEEKQIQYVLTTMLVQIALDTHESVAKLTDVNESEPQKRRRQLSVLAGDYYSGLYYFLLAEIEDYDMIQVLASAIKEINEYKMQLYYLSADSFQVYAEQVRHIESLLIVRVSEYVHEHSLIDLTKDWLLLMRLTREDNESGPKSIQTIQAADTSHGRQLSVPAAANAWIELKKNEVRNMITAMPITYNHLQEHMCKVLNAIESRQMKNAGEG